MIHYHGTPITPRFVLYALQGRNFCVSYAAPSQIKVCHEIGQSVMLDNGAFSHWTRGCGTIDVVDYWRWAEPWLDFPTTWCVVPDVIDGGEEDNDRMIAEWFGRVGGFRQAAVVWHLHESLERLDRLVSGFDKVCIGSSGGYRVVGSKRWHYRMGDAFDIVCRGSGRPRTWVHMLRGMKLIGSDYPFASVDSTNVARNHHNHPRRKDVDSKRAWAAGTAMAIDAVQCPGVWNGGKMNPRPKWKGWGDAGM